MDVLNFLKWLRGLFFLLLCVTSPLYSQDLSIRFNFGSSKIPVIGQKKLDSLLKSLNPEASYKIKLIGHTDSIGTYPNNLTLSKNRANAIKSFLSKSPLEIHFVTLGESFTKPLQRNNNEEGKAINRRCDLYVELLPEPSPEWETEVMVYPIEPRSQNTLQTKNGCQVIVAPGSFKASDSDTLQIHITEYNDPIDFLAGGLPMSYELNGKTYLYESEQMMKIEAFINKTPIKQLKLIGLKCPHLDTSRGVKFYQFKGKTPNLAFQRTKWTKGSVKHINIALNTQEKKSQSADTSIITKEETKDTALIPENTKEKIANQSSTPSKKGTKATSSQLKEKENEQDFILNPDTGRSFILEPDTGRRFAFYTEYSNYPSEISSGKTNRCYSCEQKLCDSATFLKFIDIGLKYFDASNPIASYDLDFRPYYDRYLDFGYDGTSLKTKKDTTCLFSVKVKFKKRFLRKHLVLKIPSVDVSSEYAPLRKTKWVLHYGKRNNKLALLKQLQISDLRILHGNNKKYFFIELKADTMFYAFEATPKKTTQTLKRYKDYLKLYEKRVRKFDDSLRQFFVKNETKIDSAYCLFEFTAMLSSPLLKFLPCRDSPSTFPPCYPFSFFSRRFYLDGPIWTYLNCKDIVQKLKRHPKNRTLSERPQICYFECLHDWHNYYKSKKDEFTNQFVQIKNHKIDAWNCSCNIEGPPPSLRKSPCPDSVWKPSANGDEITYIGLGIYNFDRKTVLEDKQIIPHPTYLNKSNDTILKCAKSYGMHRDSILICHYRTYTILPGFNGLLEQDENENLTVVLGKINIILFEDELTHKYYKLKLDLRKQKEPIRLKTFRLKDITQNASDIETLRQELLRE